MKPKRLILALALLVLAAALGWWWWRERAPERQVHRRLTRLAEVLSKNPGEGGATLAAKHQLLAGLFAERVEMGADIPFVGGTVTGEELASTITNVRLQFAWLDVRFHDVQVNISQSDKADVVFQARVRATGKGERRQGDEQTRTVSARLTRDPRGTWVFTEFRLVATAKEP